MQFSKRREPAGDLLHRLPMFSCPFRTFLIFLFVAGLAPLSAAADPDRTPHFTINKVKQLVHETGVSAAVWSPDGKRIATLSNLFREVTLWDSVSGTKIHEFSISKSPLACNNLAFMPDGHYLVTAEDLSAENDHHMAAVIWNADTGEVVRRVPGPFPQKNDPRWNIAHVFALSADGKQLALSSSSTPTAPLALYADENWASPILLPVFQDIPISMNFSPDGHLLAVGTVAGRLDLFDTISHNVVQSLQVYEYQAGGIKSVAFSPDGRFVATGHLSLRDQKDGELTKPLVILDGHASNILQTASESDQRIWSVSWSNDGKILATGDDRHKAIFRLAEALNLPAKTLDLAGTVMSISFAPNTMKFVAVGGVTAIIGEIVYH